MRLIGHDRSGIDLVIARYEIPLLLTEEDADYWDANWLIIDCTVASPEGSWSFRYPCLTTWETAELANWLRGVAEGAISPTDGAPRSADERPQLTFTEPHLAFDLVKSTGDDRVVRVYFSREAIPPWVAEEERAKLYGHHIDLSVTKVDLLVAAVNWSNQFVEFPFR